MNTPSVTGGTVAVVGGGIAGLTAAYRLTSAGYDVTVFEERDRVGGRMWSVRKGDFLMDLGAAFYLGTYREAIDLIHEVGLGDQFTTRPASGAVPRHGRLHHLDYSHPVRAMLTTGSLSAAAKLRAVKLAALTFRARRGLGYDAYDELAKFDDETVREYARRALGEELHEYFARPLVWGAWVADDAETSLALCLWTARNLLVPDIYNLMTGVQALPLELASRVTVRLDHAVANVETGDAGVDITFTAGDAAERTERFDGCVIATQAQPALALFPQMDDNTRALYASTRYRRLGCVCLGLSRRPTDPATYILGAPRDDPDTIAVIADHNKAPGRAPEGKGLLSVLLSHEYLQRNEHLTDDEVLQQAVAVASRYHGNLAGDIEEHAVMRWPESVPTIDRGRFKLISRYHRDLDRGARVHYASDLDRMPGLNGSVSSGNAAAQRLDLALSRAFTAALVPGR